MLRTTVTAAAILLGGVLSANAAVDCGKSYEDFWERLSQDGNAKMSAETLSSLSRAGLRGYDACQAGDEKFSTSIFDKLMRDGNFKSEEFWEKLASDGNIKK